MTARRLVGQAGLLLWLLGVAWVTLRPLRGERLLAHQPVPWSCVLCGDAGLTDVLLNLLLFAPLGLLGIYLGWRLLHVATIALCLTLTIEISQYTVIDGRDGSLSDVLTNTAGAVLGWLATRALATARPPSRSTLRRRLIVVLCTHAILWPASALLLRPALTMESPWHGGLQLNEGTGGGQLDTLSLSTDSNAVLQLASSPESLRLEGTPAPGRWLGTDIHDGLGRSYLHLRMAPEWSELWLRQQAGSWQLRNLRWRVYAPRGSPLRQVQWRWDAQGLSVEGQTSDGTVVISERFRASIAQGWALGHPFVDRITPSAWRWNLLWLAGWFFWVGWAAAPLGRTLVLCASAGALGVLSGTASWASWPLTALEVFGAILGLLLGVFCQTLWMRHGAKRPGRPAP